MSESSYTTTSSDNTSTTLPSISSGGSGSGSGSTGTSGGDPPGSQDTFGGGGFDTAPAKNLAATSITRSTNIELTWDAGADTRVIIEISADGVHDWHVLYTTTGTFSYTHNVGTWNTTWYYRANSDDHNMVYETTPPLPPINFLVTAVQATQINLSWFMYSGMKAMIADLSQCPGSVQVKIIFNSTSTRKLLSERNTLLLSASLLRNLLL